VPVGPPDSTGAMAAPCFCSFSPMMSITETPEDLFSGLAADQFVVYNLVYGVSLPENAATTPQIQLFGLRPRLCSGKLLRSGASAVNAFARPYLFWPGQAVGRKSKSPWPGTQLSILRQRLDSDPHILGKSLNWNGHAIHLWWARAAAELCIGTWRPPAAPE